MFYKVTFFIVILCFVFLGCENSVDPESQTPGEPETVNQPGTVTEVIVSPVDIVIAPLSDTKIAVTWTDESTGETGYEIQWCTDIAFPESERFTSNPSENSSSFMITELSPVTTYYIRIRAVGSSASSDWEMRVVDTLLTVSGTLSFNSGVSSTNIPEVTLNIDYAGAVEMQVYNEGEPEPDWVPFSATCAHTLSGGVGVKTVLVNLKNSGGTVFPFSKSILYETDPPVINHLSINNETVITRNSTLSLEIGVDGAIRFQLRLNGGDWIDFDTVASLDWLLTDVTQGLKTLDFRFYDEAGNMTEATRSINYDSIAPSASIAPADDDPIKNTLERDMVITTNDFYEYRYQIGTDGDWSLWINGDTGNGLAFSLPDSDGDYLITLEIRDSAGNVGTGSCSLTLDRTPPEGITLSVHNPVVSYENSSLVLTFSGGDALDISHYRLNIGSNPVGELLPISGTQTIRHYLTDFNLNEDQVYTASVELFDKAGNQVVSRRPGVPPRPRVYDAAFEIDRFQEFYFAPQSIYCNDAFSSSWPLDFIMMIRVDEVPNYWGGTQFFYREMTFEFQMTTSFGGTVWDETVEVPRWGEDDDFVIRFIVDELRYDNEYFPPLKNHVVLNRNAAFGATVNYEICVPWDNNENFGAFLSIDVTKTEE